MDRSPATAPPEPSPRDFGRARALAERIVERLRGAGYEALLAGGCVRDLLLHRTPLD